MRVNCVPHKGEIWMLSDPRRLSGFWIVEVHERDMFVVVQNVVTGHLDCKPLERFAVLGSKGYTRFR